MGRADRPATSRRLTFASIGSVGVISACVLAEHRVGLAPADVLCLLPAVALATVLRFVSYPGERTLLRLRRTRASRARRPVSSAAPRQHPVKALGGGRLIAASLAGRAPPCAAACC